MTAAFSRSMRPMRPIWLDSATSAEGISCCRMSAASCSCAVLTGANTAVMATDSMPRAANSRAARFTSAGSSGVIGRPS